MDETNSFLYIMSFLEDDSDVPAQHFVVVEQTLLTECKSIHSALITLIAAHFVFNIDYYTHVKDVLYFLLDKVMGFTDPSYCKSAMYSSVSSAIQCFLPEDNRVSYSNVPIKCMYLATISFCCADLITF